MQFWQKWRENQRLTKTEQVERDDLLQEINEAKSDWINAHKKLDFVVDKDQIDYAIFALEAAEKRYNMLLKKAKKQKFYLRADERYVNSAVSRARPTKEENA